MKDYSEQPVINRIYSGSEKKIAVDIDGIPYILKFQLKDQFGVRFNHISEHLGSSIFNMLGIPAQKTELGTYNNENVVACRIFTSEKIGFVPFDDIGESSLELVDRNTQYSYEDIMYLLEMNKKLTHLDETIDRFWDMFTIDGLLGNFDRHGSNWGFLKENNRYCFAPVFDNGSCLYPRMTDETMMLSIINSEEETEERIFKYPPSQIKINGGRSSYYEIIRSHRFPECDAALRRIYPRIDLPKISSLIDTIENITDTHKTFYKHMICARYSKILSSSFEEMLP